MVYKDYMLTNLHFRDLNPRNAGEEACASGKKFGPYVRTYTLIHYVISGSGTLYAQGSQYPVHAGEAFLILPDEITTYTADIQDPWHYQWIGFDGALSEEFAKLPRIFKINSDIFPKIIRSAALSAGAEYQVTAMLFRLYAELFATGSGSNQHVRKVESFIDANYMQPITVELIANRMNLDRRYLTRLFKEKTGQTIQEYLISVRLKEACEYLLQGFDVHETASLCGYEDTSNFSRMFKKHYGLSPAYWKRERSGEGI